ncbi:MAG: cytosine deaminase, partial [Pseudomonadota bacterium]
MDFVQLPDAQTFRLTNISVPGHLLGRSESLVRTSLTLAGDTIVADDPDATMQQDMAGAIVFPCFVDMHTHLDKAQIWARTPNPDGSFEGALHAVNSDKPGRWDRADLMPRMSFALRSAFAHGTRFIRTHLDYFGDLGDAEQSWPVFAELQENWSGRIDLQAAVLTGCDLGAEPAAVARCADLVAAYGGILGTVTYNEPGVRDWVRAFFEAAMARDLPLDFHVDETLDPASNTLRTVAELALETGFGRKITVGHLCSLSTMPEKDALVASNLTAVETRANGGIDLYNQIHQEKMGVYFLGWFDSNVSYNLWFVNEPQLH